MIASLSNRSFSLFLGLSAKRFNCATPFCETMDLEDAFSFSADESRNVTEDDIPGPGRLMGKFYAVLGRKIETVLSRAGHSMGRGPAPVAARIEKLMWSEAPGAVKKCKKECKTLVKYTRCFSCHIYYTMANQIIDLGQNPHASRPLTRSFLYRCSTATSSCCFEVWVQPR